MEILLATSTRQPAATRRNLIIDDLRYTCSATWHNFCAMSAAAVVDFSSIVTLQHMSRAAAKCLTGNLRNTADNDRESRAFIVECSFLLYGQSVNMLYTLQCSGSACTGNSFILTHYKKKSYTRIWWDTPALRVEKKRKHPEEREGGRVLVGIIWNRCSRDVRSSSFTSPHSSHVIISCACNKPFFTRNHRLGQEFVCLFNRKVRKMLEVRTSMIDPSRLCPEVY